MTSRCAVRPIVYARVRDYCPGLPDNSLVPDYAGIRPKIYRPGRDARSADQ